jgi:hypothetical protein
MILRAKDCLCGAIEIVDNGAHKQAQEKATYFPAKAYDLSRLGLPESRSARPQE